MKLKRKRRKILRLENQKEILDLDRSTLCMSAIQRQERLKKLPMVTQRVVSKETGIVLKHGSPMQHAIAVLTKKIEPKQCTGLVVLTKTLAKMYRGDFGNVRYYKR